MNRFSVIASPLEGLNLIEANAGTGKTWTIAALHLRLLLEAARPVESILVVTFTEAATAELRDRIRKRVAQAWSAFERGRADQEDAVAAALLERVPDRVEAALRLATALQNFDQAPIHTIHGFCQRVLADRAFESGMPFTTELLPDVSDLLQEIVDDFWRIELARASPLFLRYVLAQGLEPSALREELKGRVGKPYLLVRHPEAPSDTSALEKAYEAQYAEARKIWAEARQTIHDQLAGNPALNAGRYRKEWVASWMRQMDACLGPESAALRLFKQFEKFTPHALEEATRKGALRPHHRFYEACAELSDTHEALQKAFAARVAHLKARLIQYANEQLALRKQQRRLQSYDDLLLNLERALAQPGGDALCEAVRSRYTAALIDEFQDTDPVQYRIFGRIYGKTDLPVFLVGDPKQSIYSFRGADVFAYLKARREARRAQTLDVNWRSDPRLLTAINTLFERAAKPFVIADISFHRSEAAAGNRGFFEVEGESGAPLEIWHVASAERKRLAKSDACALVAGATAAEIARLLQLGALNKARIGEPANGAVRERALTGGDIAVLVRTHHQARIVREALRACGVASVERGMENVFASGEAEELERVLMGIAEPVREPLLRAALTTDLLGYSGLDLDALAGDEARWEAVIESFGEFHRQWRDRGFIRMVREFFEHFGVIARLLDYADGERRVTNVLHLAERLHREAGRLGIAGLMEWFSRRRKYPPKGHEEELLRLESDENLVKILTVHAAKGLEYPLVFCPFLWDGGLRAAQAPAVMFHDPAQEDALVLDLGSEQLPGARVLAQREERAEALRLMYVAVTRAKYRCWMAWGDINDADTSAPAWLLHAGPEEGKPDIRSPADDEAITATALTDAKIRAALDNLVARAQGTIRVSPLPMAEHVRGEPAVTSVADFSCRKFTGTLRPAWGVTSFSGLTRAHGAELPDYDAADRGMPVEAAGAREDIFAFPRGAQAGKCLHAIFEQVDFCDFSRGDLEGLVSRELEAHGFDPSWRTVVADTVERVVSTPLDDAGALRLARVPRSQRLNELEFYYPIAQLQDAALRALLLRSGFPEAIRTRIEDLSFFPQHGYMKGFIDLVFKADGRFHLVDYKSNWLGPAHDDYRPDALRQAMARETYFLQYLVYCVALHRYLRSRIVGYDYETHFGAVHYLFVRGMHPRFGCGRGVYTDRPPADLIASLDAYLAGGSDQS